MRTFQHFAAVFQSENGIFKSRCLRVICDILNFSQLHFHAIIEGGLIMRVLNFVELWRLVLQWTLLQERVIGHGGRNGYLNRMIGFFHSGTGGGERQT